MATKKTTKALAKYKATWNKRVNDTIVAVTVVVTKKGNDYVDENGVAVPEWAEITKL